MRTNMSKKIFMAVGLAFSIIYPLLFTLPFPRHLMIMIFMYATMGLAWNMIGGYAGQISLGHCIFFGTGAYTSTLMLMKLGITPWIGMITGAGVAMIIAFIIGY